MSHSPTLEHILSSICDTQRLLEKKLNALSNSSSRFLGKYAQDTKEMKGRMEDLIEILEALRKNPGKNIAVNQGQNQVIQNPPRNVSSLNNQNRNHNGRKQQTASTDIKSIEKVGSNQHAGIKNQVRPQEQNDSKPKKFFKRRPYHPRKNEVKGPTNSTQSSNIGADTDSKKSAGIENKTKDSTKSKVLDHATKMPRNMESLCWRDDRKLPVNADQQSSLPRAVVDSHSLKESDKQPASSAVLPSVSVTRNSDVLSKSEKETTPSSEVLQKEESEKKDPRVENISEKRFVLLDGPSVSNSSLNTEKKEGETSSGNAALDEKTVQAPQVRAELPRNFVSSTRQLSDFNDLSVTSQVFPLLDKFVYNKDIKDIEYLMKDNLIRQQKFMDSFIEYFLEKRDSQMHIAPVLQLLLNSDYSSFTAFHVIEGFYKCFLNKQDLLIKYPELWNDLALLMAHTLLSMEFNFDHLQQSCRPVLRTKISKEVLSLVFNELTSMESLFWISCKWNSSNVELNNFIADNSVNEFIESHDLEYLQSSGDLGTCVVTPLFHEIRSKVLQLFRKFLEEDLAHSHVSLFIHDKMGRGPYNHDVVCPLITAICEASVIDIHENGVFDPDYLLNMDYHIDLILNVTNSNADSEAHCLIALSMLMETLRLPEELPARLISEFSRTLKHWNKTANAEV